LTAEDVGDHAVLVSEVWHAAAVPLHARGLALLFGAPVVEVERVPPCQCETARARRAAR
jgi:hypothetical protein